MILPAIFYVSLVCIALLLLTKVREMRTHRQPFLLRVISLGDERMKELSQRSAHWYADRKEDLVFFFDKQLPMHSRRIWGKTQDLVLEKWNLLKSDLHEMRILKRSEGLSEFLQAKEEEKELHEEFLQVASESEASEEMENRVE